MKRRSFLSSAAALVPATALSAFAFAQTSAPPREAFLVPSGEDREGLAHTLGFSRILFKVLSSETAGGLFVIEHEHLTKGGPPLHLHLYQDEWFYILEGAVDFQIGDKRFRLGPGDSAFGPRGIPHAFSLLGDSPGRMLIAFTPAGKMEQFFRAVAIPNGPGMTPEIFASHQMKYIGPSPFA